MAYLLLVISCMVAPTLQFAVFTVGQERGWILGVDYKAWAKGKNFKVGDSLGQSSHHFFFWFSSHHPVI